MDYDRRPEKRGRIAYEESIVRGYEVSSFLFLLSFLLSFLLRKRHGVFFPILDNRSFLFTSKAKLWMLGSVLCPILSNIIVVAFYLSEGLLMLSHELIDMSVLSLLDFMHFLFATKLTIITYAFYLSANAITSLFSENQRMV